MDLEVHVPEQLVRHVNSRAGPGCVEPTVLWPLVSPNVGIGGDTWIQILSCILEHIDILQEIVSEANASARLLGATTPFARMHMTPVLQMVQITVIRSSPAIL